MLVYGFHPSFTKGTDKEAVSARRAEKKACVERGEAHVALVYYDACVGWAQYGGCEELPQIRSKRAHDAGQDRKLPDWRITCFFTDKAHRKE